MSHLGNTGIPAGKVDTPTAPWERFRRRNLPHWEIAGSWYFVTFRLDGSLPRHLLEQWRQERKELRENAELSRAEIAKAALRLHSKFDSQLDRAEFGPAFLAEPVNASIVVHALHHFDRVRYLLAAYAVMPNHVHVVLRPFMKTETTPWGLDELTHSIKSFTANQINRARKCKETVWQHESYDRLVRDEQELYHWIEYTLNNPVAAGLCSTRDAWRWSNAAAWSAEHSTDFHSTGRDAASDWRLERQTGFHSTGRDAGPTLAEAVSGVVN